MKYYVAVIKKYATFKGRARRKEYWMFLLIDFIIIFFLSGLSFQFQFFRIVYFIYGIFIFLPSLTVLVRRYHDTDHSGILAVFMHIIISICVCLYFILSLTYYEPLKILPLTFGIFTGLINLIITIQEGAWGENKYGADPKRDNNPIVPTNIYEPIDKTIQEETIFLKFSIMSGN